MFEISKYSKTETHLTKRAPDVGSLRHFRAFFWLRVFPAPKQNLHPPTRSTWLVSGRISSTSFSFDHHTPGQCSTFSPHHHQPRPPPSPYHDRASIGHCGRVSPTLFPLSPHHHWASFGGRGRVPPPSPPFTILSPGQFWALRPRSPD